ncbi:hypothetical protein VSQ82_08675 [Pseudomonas sp. MS-1(2024)]|uniref:hypothetical protein n=1 Tax=Pseudomonas sp. MS-1(2024) TaxID=3112251 RepID=UPI002DBE9069|nr:hypothetical protein [Pseudomonas sp. MS-1(2024)]MEC4167317.1 hypothetical protein [Pseudomonas sp. MS-1(2024)]
MNKNVFKYFFQEWCSVQSVCLFLCFIYLVALMVRVFELDSGDVASWVQALGAIISIWAAWWIARQQSKRTAAENKGKDLAKCFAIIGLLEHVLRIVRHEPRKNKATISGAEVRSGFGKALSMLDRVDVLMLPDIVLVRAVFEVRHEVELLDLKVKNYLSPGADVIMCFNYERGISVECIAVLKKQIILCEEIAYKYS